MGAIVTKPDFESDTITALLQCKYFSTREFTGRNSFDAMADFSTR